MNDVNLNSTDLTLVSTKVPARASTSPQAEGVKPSARVQESAASTVVSLAPPTTSASAQEDKQKVQGESLNQAVSQLNDFVQTVQRDLHFEVDNGSGKTIVRVVDQQTDKVIRQIPDDVALRLAEKLQQDEPLTLFNIEV
ncbi:MAG: flagellar biosynthesis protein FlaG [Alteromonadaceae bacterium]|nr:flagellar biosynthesis protein FlaG [Alteromonadaceae bacterium]MBH85914.1 flagellar biosynthesis protein FlaG [Alteromonadaceae bacterium]|tara:strand:- start:51118 stop:51537 length:420 start_codon:yes stop_codon:yes gene_type:complete